MELEQSNKPYGELINQISSAYQKGQQRAVQVVNLSIVDTYWNIGRIIVEFELAGENRAIYGKQLIENLAKDLFLKHGKGFSRSNLNYMRMFYSQYPICETVSRKLGWSHFLELLKIDDPLERSFYEQQCVIENWSVRELKRQKQSSLFFRLAASKDKGAILDLAKQGQTVIRPEDIVRDSYVLDFLKIPEPNRYSEMELEQKIVEHLQQFLMELGKGFAFVARQYRITFRESTSFC